MTAKVPAWTEADDARLRAYCAQGLGDDRIAALEGRTPHAVRCRRGRLGLLRLSDAQSKLAGDNLPLACLIAGRLARPRRFACLDRHEVESAAGSAAVSAAFVFDPRKGKFGTILQWHVRQRLEAAVMTSRVVRVPGNLSPANLARAKSVRLRPLADFDTPAPEPRETPDPEALAGLHAAVEALPDREREAVLGHCLGGRTLDAIGASLGVTKERVRQLRNAGLARLRRLMGAA